MTDGATPRGFHLLDLSALVVGYGLASLLIRAFWTAASEETTAVVTVALIYLWLGMAMSGPLVLFRYRRSASQKSPYTWAELAWLIIGFYWIGLTILMVPIRLRGTRVLDAGLVGVFPFLAALVLRFLSPRRSTETGAASTRTWTHRTAVGLLLSWPLIWLALILVGKTLL